MNTIWTAATQTPWWVYVLFIYLVQRGISASKSQVVSIKKLTILPVVFIALSIHTLMTAFHVNTAAILVWFASIAVGSAIGWLLVCRHQFKVDRKKLLIQLPGSWVTLILILAIFVSKYYFSYQIGSDPALENQTGFEFSMLAISGICTGLFIGRLLCYFHKLWTCESVDLSAS